MCLENYLEGYVGSSGIWDIILTERNSSSSKNDGIRNLVFSNSIVFCRYSTFLRDMYTMGTLGNLFQNHVGCYSMPI